MGLFYMELNFSTVLDQDGREFAQILSRTFLFISWRSSVLDPQETNTHNFHRQSIELGISNWKTDASIIQIAFFTSDINVKLFFQFQINHKVFSELSNLIIEGNFPLYHCIGFKVWGIKNETRKLAISKKSTFFVQSSWNWGKIITSRAYNTHQFLWG